MGRMLRFKKGADMSGSQKVINVFSIIAIIGGVIAALFAVLMFAGMGLVAGETTELEGTVVDQSFVAGAAGVAFVLTAVEYLVAGILGVRGAHDARKIGPFYIVCWIVVILQLISFVLDLIAGGDMGVIIGGHVGGLIIPVILLVLAGKVKKQA